ncbi:C40 family peptidase [Niabella terrae]
MKIVPLLLLILFSGCNLLKKAPQQDYSQFIFEDGFGQPVDVAVIKDSTRTPDDPVIQEAQTASTPVLKSGEEARLKSKYAGFLEVSPDQIRDITLYRFIDDWLYTPYRWAGTTKRGIDCSAFIQRLFADVYHIRIPRTSIQQFYTQNVERFRVRQELAKGDLVFFQTLNNGQDVSHVGMYLDNNRFVNASSSQGVSIARLNDPYWSARYVGAGRLIVNKSARINN